MDRGKLNFSLGLADKTPRFAEVAQPDPEVGGSGERPAEATLSETGLAAMYDRPIRRFKSCPRHQQTTEENTWPQRIELPVRDSNLDGFPVKNVERYFSAREDYRPDKILLLLVAESPPSSGGYFYFRKTIGKDHLFRETMKALDLWPRSQKMTKGIDKAPYLNQFMKRKFFLIDTCERPVDKLPRKSRMLQIAKGASTLAKRVDDLDPLRILIIKKTIFDPAQRAIAASGLAGRILNKTPIPFPSHGHQGRFRTEFRRLTRGIGEKPI